ncbi:bifunctional oligoribonuclease/PAP phosphatase NrnA [Nitratiruptor sp. YY09-18]|uniref:DHH family phosphoesterase n=1 Tax=Nitratiruptor sp. YY09-18 TaxID=2724901 RepID=UPI0019165B43|nr:bifunctional oligoribonuclease/PAP phosphatase NrnA [Nitratiruptor sp. YY09-18]BCD67572.1 bifunctional oligoribonuclease and PAP phosphatase NrnA [Nitratiruptor sp. YY09-18]
MKQAWEVIKQAKKIALLTHLNPDADTLGSALGFWHYLKKDKKCDVFNLSQLPYNLDFLPGIKKVKCYEPKGYDLWISFDCGSFDRLGLSSKDALLINIDHHKSNTMYGDFNIIDPHAAATSQVAYNFLRSQGASIDNNTALCFYTALVDDTGFFKYDSVDAEVFAFAKELVEAGASPEYVANMLTMREPLAKLRLIPLVLNTLELVLNAQVAIIYLTQQMLAQTGATKEMADDALTMARSLATVEVAMLLREEEDGRIKVSLRSKNYVDVSLIAAAFGGGGHKRAAGFTSHLHEFDTVKAMLLEKIKGELLAKKE